MLKNLSISNYVLIDSLHIDFHEGFSAITGETGAGKSIIIGGLGLILGKRADTATLLNEEKKCIIEGTFDVSAFQLTQFFEENDLDYDALTRIRREITPQGKSRAFINDTPVNLNLLKQLGELLIDIHSQHNTLLIHDLDYQLDLLDAFAGNDQLKEKYLEKYLEFRKSQALSIKLQKQLAQAQADNDYIRFLLEELEAAQIGIGETEEIENELNLLNHAEEIKTAWLQTSDTLNSDNQGVLSQVNQLLQQLRPVQNFQPELSSIYERLNSVYIELDDLAREAVSMEDSVEIDPKKQEFLNERLSLIFKLIKKHQLQNAEELKLKEESLANQLFSSDEMQNQLNELEKRLQIDQQELTILAKNLNSEREKAAQPLANQLQEQLMLLGIPDAQIVFKLQTLPDFAETGLDEIAFLFSANAGLKPDLVSKTASGGELSRLMLSIKYLLASKRNLPSIIFDEIDSGVSGEIAERLGILMQQLGTRMQVLSITHLPQIAALAKNHYLVYKKNETTFARTEIKKLTQEERVEELAAMLSGSEISQYARDNALALLRNK
ncbi:MAG: DNA repair protein RecN [Bacteroidales bacterium]|nr:DNA repair protein RecN [Bacteroidales bacterium]